MTRRPDARASRIATAKSPESSVIAWPPNLTTKVLLIYRFLAGIVLKNRQVRR